jgi:hypothetical protein
MAFGQDPIAVKSYADEWPRVKVSFNSASEGMEAKLFTLTLGPDNSSFPAESLTTERMESLGTKETVVVAFASATLNPEDMASLKEGLTYYSQNADPREKLALATFDGENWTSSGLNTDRKPFTENLDGLKPVGPKAELYGAMLFALDLLNSQGGDKSLLVISEGGYEEKELTYFDVLESASANDVKITAIELPSAKAAETDTDSILEYLAKETEGEFLKVKSGEDISRAFDGFVKDRNQGDGNVFTHTLLFSIDPDFMVSTPEIRAVLIGPLGMGEGSAELTLRLPLDVVSEGESTPVMVMEKVLKEDKKIGTKIIDYFLKNPIYLALLGLGLIIISVGAFILIRHERIKQREALVNHTNVLHPYFEPLKKEPKNDLSPYVLYFPLLNKRYPLKLGNNSLGAGKANDLNLDMPAVSGRHAEFFVTESECRVNDLDSTNGTMVNGTLTARATIVKIGDEITFGDTMAILTREKEEV